MNTSGSREWFAENGWCILREAMPRPLAAALGARVVDQLPAMTRVDRPGTGVPDPVTLDEGGDYHYSIGSTSWAEEHLPELFGFYRALATITALLTDQSVVYAHETTSLTVKAHHLPGDCHGWHRDTNPLTALLYLTPTGSEHGTVIQVEGAAAWWQVVADPGDLLVMRGREVAHWVPPLNDGTPPRVVVPCNLYHPDDVWRPEGIDAVVYGA